MDISIVIPVYNGEETLKLCLDAVTAMSVPDGMRTEILLINDGSTDRTKEIASGYPRVRVIDHEMNMGRMQARKTGAEKAAFDDLLLIDTRIEPGKDLLIKIKEIGYQPLMAGNLNDDKYKSDYDTVFYLIRRKFYKPYYPQIRYAKELWITEENFIKAPKGTGCLFLKKDLFLKSIPESIEKDSSDDTAILKNIVFNSGTRILRHAELSIKYNSRTDEQITMWIHHRGKTFADHYLRFMNKYSVLYFTFLAILTYFVIFNPIRLIMLAVLILFLAVLYLFEDGRDIMPILKKLPVLGFIFFIGSLEKLFKMTFSK